MTQPSEAVGGEDFIVPTEPTVEDRLSAALSDELDEEQAAPTEETEQTDPEATETDEVEAEATEDEPEIEADDLPPIDAPISWTAEEKEEFSKLPREVQETLSRREEQREKFVQTKAQEAAHKERAAMKQAAEYIQQIEAEAAQSLELLATQFAVPEPDMALMVSEHPGDRALFAQQAQAFKNWQARMGHAQSQIAEARERQQHYNALVQQHEAEQFRQRLTSELPEFFDEAKGPALKEALTATGKALGFTDEDLFNANANQLIALKHVTDLKAKADKYDALMKRRMEQVRQGKGSLPPVSKPGVKKGTEARSATAYASDREAMKHGDDAALQRVLRAHINS